MTRPALALAAGALFAFAATAATAPAHAADPAPALTGPAEVVLQPRPASGEPVRAALDVALDAPDAPGDGAYTVTFDLRGLAGVAEARFAPGVGHCVLTGTEGVCTGSGTGPVARLELATARGALPGATGTVRATGAIGGSAVAPLSTRVAVGAPDLVMEPLRLKRDVKPGESQPAALTFANEGAADARGVLLTLRWSHGLDVPQRYDNCAYDEDATGTTVRCAVEGVFEAGAAYQLAEPLTVRAQRHAYHEEFVYRIEELALGPGARSRSALGFTGGGGAGTLTLEKQAARVTSRESAGRGEQRDELRAANTADFAAYGARAELPGEGGTVRIAVGVRNRGPAWIADLRGATVDVRLPQGTRAVASPANCRAVQGNRYTCTLPGAVHEDADLRLPFTLKADRVVPGARGTVTVTGPLPFDRRPANDTAYILLNATAQGGTSGGDSGTTGGTATPVATATPSPGSTPGGAAPRSGALAATGTDSLLATGAGLAALGAGAAVLATARRRARA
ncbi:peptidase [Streptomyces sp. NPDC001941]|uniref:peptidase n=1 Tax=Streptomyces sp. NPDC001941 TaxID=3154659 RepID=UPI0033202DE6